ncbi:MAG: T9SS type A sorting domain-containing protein [Chitinophagaceae bacterium]
MKLLILFLFTLLGMQVMLKAQQPFTAGNIVVYRVGDGSSPLGPAMQKVYLDEYTPAGTRVQSIPMPSTGSKLTMFGFMQDAGYLTLSTDGKYLAVPGWDVEPGLSPGTITGINRSVALVDYNGAVSSVMVITQNPASSLINAAATVDGTGFWITGDGRVDYVPVSTGVPVNLTTVLGINTIAIGYGNLYAGTNVRAQPMLQIGTGLPVITGQAAATLSGFPQRTNVRQFAFADLNPAIPGPDVLYLASQSGTAGGIQKYSLVGAGWVANGVIGTSADLYAGLTINVAANGVTIFATRKGNNISTNTGGELVSLLDNSGYNAAITGTPAVLASVAVTDAMSFKGVAIVPQNCAGPQNLNVINVTPSSATLSWVSGGGSYEYFVSTSATPPAFGTATGSNPVNVTGLADGTTYYAHVRTSCGLQYASAWNTVSFQTGCKPPMQNELQLDATATGILNASWRKVAGAMNYEYAVTTSLTAPGSGTATTDTSFVMPNLNSVTQYYVHIRSSCGPGKFSLWTTKPFATGCFMPVPVVVSLPGSAGVSWNAVDNAIKYEYSLSSHSSSPFSGAYTTDTSYSAYSVKAGTKYYFHVRSVCASGKMSPWATIAFNTQGLQLYPNPVEGMLNIRVNGGTVLTGDVKIYDGFGRMVARVPVNNGTGSVNTSAWAPGIYYARYNDGKEIKAVQFIKR